MGRRTREECVALAGRCAQAQAGRWRRRRPSRAVSATPTSPVPTSSSVPGSGTGAPGCPGPAPRGARAISAPGRSAGGGTVAPRPSAEKLSGFWRGAVAGGAPVGAPGADGAWAATTAEHSADRRMQRVVRTGAPTRMRGPGCRAREGGVGNSGAGTKHLSEAGARDKQAQCEGVDKTLPPRRRSRYPAPRLVPGRPPVAQATGGKSGLHRARWWATPTVRAAGNRRTDRDSATENRPPDGRASRQRQG